MSEKILVVVKEPATGFDLVMEIEQLGYEVVGLTDRAEDALEVAYLLEPDPALIEIAISGASDAFHTVRLLSGVFEIPVIFVASNIDPSTFARTEEAFPLGYLRKPFKRDMLKASIEFALRHTRKRRACRRPSITSEIQTGKGEIVPA